jgi:hypothetical protein
VIRLEQEQVYLWLAIQNYLEENQFDFMEDEWSEIKYNIKMMCAQEQKDKNGLLVGAREQAEMDKYFDRMVTKPEYVLNKIEEQKKKADAGVDKEFIEEQIRMAKEEG